MPLFRTCPFEELVVRATDENNVTDDWALILEIVDKAVNYDDGPKLILQAITKRLYSNVPRVVIQALMLLDACVKNCGRRFHLEVSNRIFVAEIRKILQKMNPTVINKFKSLIKRWAEVDFKDDPELGLIPSLYYKLKSEGVQFPEEQESKPLPPPCTNPDAVSSQEEEEDIVKAITLSLKETKSVGTNGTLYDLKEFREPIKVELTKARALYDFDAVEDNELTIRAGEIVVITDKSNESWWKGSNQRGEGYLPVSFVTEDLDAPIELLNASESTSKIEEEQVDESPVEVDEKKIQVTLQLLNDIDPSDEYSDEKVLLDLERECYAMSPLIDEKLQEIDKRCTMLNSLNEDIMKAIQTFYKLTRDSLVPAQFSYYYNMSPEGLVLNQPMQEPVSSQVDATAVASQTMQKQVMAGNFCIPQNFLPNLTPLTANQIRQNVVNLPFIHPQYLPMHYNMLSQKMNTGVNYLMPGPSLSNSDYMTTIPQSQVLAKPDVEDSKNNFSNHSDQNTLEMSNQLTLLDTENFTSIPPHESSSLTNQNVPSTMNNGNNSIITPTNNGQSSELPVQNYMTQNTAISSATTSIIEHNQNGLMNGRSILTNNFLPTDNVSLSNERLTENGIINQNGH